MTDRELNRFLLGLLDNMTMISREQRDRLKLKMRTSTTQDEFRLNLLLDAIAVIESDFLKSDMSHNVVQFPLKKP